MVQNLTTALWNSLVAYTDDICFLEHPKETVESFTVGKPSVESVGRLCYAARLVYSSQCLGDRNYSPYSKLR